MPSAAVILDQLKAKARRINLDGMAEFGMAEVFFNMVCLLEGLDLDARPSREVKRAHIVTVSLCRTARRVSLCDRSLAGPYHRVDRHALVLLFLSSGVC